MEKACAWRLPKLQLEGDSLTVIQALIHPQLAAGWTTDQYIEEILEILSSFVEWQACFIHRSASILAHDWARLKGRQFGCSRSAYTPLIAQDKDPP